MSMSNTSKSLKVFGAVCFLFVARRQYLKLYRKFKNYPPGSCSPLQCLLQFALNPTQFLFNIGKKHGAVATVPIGICTNIFINDAHLAQKILKNESSLNRSKMIISQTRASNSCILPLLNGAEWAKRRRYGGSQLLTITDSNFIFNSVENSMQNYVIPDIEHHITSNTLWYSSLYTEYMTFNSIFAALFGCTIDLHIEDEDNFFTKWRQIINALGRLKSKLHILDMGGLTAPQWIANLLARGTNIEHGIDALIIAWMQQNGFRIDLEKGTISTARNSKNSFCHAMIEKINQQNNGVTDYSVGALIADLGTYLISGYHTTSNCADYGLLLLAQNVDLQNEIYKELDASNVITETHLFRAFIFEAVRLATILPIGLPHFVDADIFCGEAVGCVIPKGSTVLINHLYVHKSNNGYWRNELQVNKWLDGKGKFKMNSNFVMFGYGKRDCIGKTLAIKQLYAMFAALIRRYRFALDGESKDLEIKQRWHALLEVHPKVGIAIIRR